MILVGCEDARALIPRELDEAVEGWVLGKGVLAKPVDVPPRFRGDEGEFVG